MRFGVSDGSFVAGRLPLPLPSGEPPLSTSSSRTSGRSAGAAGVSALPFQLSSLPGSSGGGSRLRNAAGPRFRLPGSAAAAARAAVTAEPGAAAAPPGAYKCPASPCAEPPSRVT